MRDIAESHADDRRVPRHEESPGDGLPGVAIPFDPAPPDLSATLDSREFQQAVNEQSNHAQPFMGRAGVPQPARDAFSSENLERRFKSHPLSEEQQDRAQQLRDKGREFAEMALLHCSRSPERTLAIRKIEEAVFWLVAGIARNE